VKGLITREVFYDTTGRTGFKNVTLELLMMSSSRPIPLAGSIESAAENEGQKSDE
jgi:hypothetical protein